jgi:hypothetical protein
MRTSMILTAVLSLSLAACATDDTYDGETLPGPTVSKVVCPQGCDDDIQTTLDNGEWIPVTDSAFVRSRSTLDDGAGICERLPATGQCAFACDTAGFIESLPPGTCAAVRCAFPDGGELVVGGCRP